MKLHTSKIFSAGFQFLESPRWHDGKLWVSDFFGHRVVTLDSSGTPSTFIEVDDEPSGLGFLADGSLLVVSKHDASVLKVTSDGAIEKYAEFSEFAEGPGNDMFVAPNGHSYVGNYGPQGGTTNLVHVAPDGSVNRLDGDLSFPNGIIQTPDGTLLVAETLGHRITAFDIADDGSLANTRVWAQLDESLHPDGIELDSDGGVWFGNAIALGEESGFYRVVEGGEITDKVAIAGAWAVACTFGGPDLATLYMTCNVTDLEQFELKHSSGYIAQAAVGYRGSFSNKG
ncbi:5-valerolactone hydrolase [Nocardia uniformis]|uniref:5-valerolactone hydrolase n=1 Tax=Nocardia uniformis TaxID=53432 RepID=A0A849C513_9NOCA|nr:SMP-30/gluconolactonase/LRE family protein [Nocardia uniformis]NNH70897.1 5-valerolactone hydrolase [Nocardia uniformis]